MYTKQISLMIVRIAISSCFLKGKLLRVIDIPIILWEQLEVVVAELFDYITLVIVIYHTRIGCLVEPKEGQMSSKFNNENFGYTRMLNCYHLECMLSGEASISCWLCQVIVSKLTHDLVFRSLGVLREI